jgi:exocyst complex protein 7
MEPPEDKRTPLDSAEELILRWDSTASEEARERMIFESDRDEVDRYLQAVDEIQLSLSSASLSGDEQQSGNKANSTIQIAMARLEDEFRNILLNHTSPIEPDSLHSTATSADPGSSSISSTGTPSAELDDLDYDHLSEEDLAASSGRSSYRSTSSIREIDLVPSDAVLDSASAFRCTAASGNWPLTRVSGGWGSRS